MNLLSALRAAVRPGPELPAGAFSAPEVRRAVEAGLGPLLLRAIGPDAAATSPIREMLLAADLTARVVMAQQLDAMTEIIDACEGRTPPLVLLKGISLCERYYPEPHLRPMRDIDVLVEPDAAPAVEAILATLGYRPRSSHPLAFYAGHHHGCPHWHPATGVWVEVHRGLFSPRSALGSDPLFAPQHVAAELRPSQFRGRPVRRLSDELQLVHVACHWAYSLRLRDGLVGIMDGVLLLGQRAARLDWDRLLDWLTISPASRYLHLFLGYLDRHRLVKVSPDVLRRLGRLRTFGRITRPMAHALLDQCLAGRGGIGLLVSERNFNRLWKRVVARRAVIADGVSGPADPEEAPMTMSETTLAPGTSPAAGDTDVGAGYPRRRPDVRGRLVDGQAVILDRQRQLVHQLNETAWYIWERCDGRHTVRGIAEEVAQAFHMDVALVEADVVATVRTLADLGLLRMRSRSVSP